MQLPIRQTLRPLTWQPIKLSARLQGVTSAANQTLSLTPGSDVSVHAGLLHTLICEIGITFSVALLEGQCVQYVEFS